MERGQGHFCLSQPNTLQWVHTLTGTTGPSVRRMDTEPRRCGLSMELVFSDYWMNEQMDGWMEDEVDGWRDGGWMGEIMDDDA